MSLPLVLLRQRRFHTGGEPYAFIGNDFLFDMNAQETVYKDSLKESQVSTSGDPIGYVEDSAT